MRAGDHAVEVWQSSQTLLVLICVADLPVAVVPLWQDEQLLLVPLWLHVPDDPAGGRQALDDDADDAEWLAGFPRALVPLWQLAQVPMTSL